MDNKMIEELSSILNNKDELNKFKNFLGVDDSFFNNENESTNNKSTKNNNSNNNFSNIFSGINGEQMMMFQNILGNFGTSNDSKSNSLLLSLKPFLSTERQSKVDMAINLLRMIEFMPMINNNLFGGFNNNENK